MYAIASIAIAGWLMLVATSLTVRFDQLAAAYREQVGDQNVRVLAAGVQRYARDAGALPVSLAAMTATQGFESLRSAIGPTVGYALGTGIADGVWTFDRATITRIDPSNTTLAAVLAGNACGTGAFAAASSWCGPAEHAVWWRGETRDGAAGRLSASRAGMNTTLQLFADYYSANQSFPGATDGMTAGTSATLASLTGYTGTAAGCSGAWSWHGIPFDCGALFDKAGDPVSYQYTADKHITLFSTTPVRNAGGTAITVAVDLDATKLGS